MRISVISSVSAWFAVARAACRAGSASESRAAFTAACSRACSRSAGAGGEILGHVGTAVDAVRRHAERIVDTHPLKAADALQIGAALVAAQQNLALHEFVTLDASLAASAEREGLRVLTWP